MKHRALILAAAVTAGFLTSCGETETESAHAPIYVDFLKVGKADAMVVKTPEHTVVIDCGEKSDSSKVLDHLEAVGSDKVDYLIITHFDQDHVGGAAKVVKNVTVERVLAPDYHEDSTEYLRLRDAMDRNDLEFESPTEMMSFTLDDLEFEVYPPEKSTYNDGNDNNSSLIVRIKYFDNTFILTGDAMEERLDEVMELGDCDVLKIPYHGRNIDNLGEFLDKTTPEYAIVSTDQKNYSTKVDNLLIEKKIETYVTYRDGSIRCTSDGKRVTVAAQGIS